MKYRHELILDFMLAITSGSGGKELNVSEVYSLAAELADRYLAMEDR
jgi:hypothetical protein